MVLSRIDSTLCNLISKGSACFPGGSKELIRREVRPGEFIESPWAFTAGRRMGMNVLWEDVEHQEANMSPGCPTLMDAVIF